MIRGLTATVCTLLASSNVSCAVFSCRISAAQIMCTSYHNITVYSGDSCAVLQILLTFTLLIIIIIIHLFQFVQYEKGTTIAQPLNDIERGGK